jgi:hypothetical protein
MWRFKRLTIVLRFAPRFKQKLLEFLHLEIDGFFRARDASQLNLFVGLIEFRMAGVDFV